MFESSLVNGIGILCFILICFIVQIIALIDALRANFRKENDKLIWVLVIIFLGIVGAIIYLLMSPDSKNGSKRLR